MTTDKPTAIEKIKELEKRVEALEKRPHCCHIPYYPVSQPPQRDWRESNMRFCNRCGGQIIGLHVC